MLQTREKPNIKIVREARAKLPKSLYEMAGAFKHQKKALERHAKNIRAEWGK